MFGVGSPNCRVDFCDFWIASWNFSEPTNNWDFWEFGDKLRKSKKIGDRAFSS
jgi:hypothetical protein